MASYDCMIYVSPNYDCLTAAIALQCNLVGVIKNGQSDNMVARVSIVNMFGVCLYNTYVRPTREVIDDRYKLNGFTEAELEYGKHIQNVRKIVIDMIRDRVLVGHNIQRALKNLGCAHSDVREITEYVLFRTQGDEQRSLNSLSKQFLGMGIPDRPHDSVKHAQTAMNLYLFHLVYEDRYSQESSSSEADCDTAYDD